MLEALKNNKQIKTVFLIFILAFLIRLIGVQHGFPFIFHPDEPAVVRSAQGIRFNPNPGHFDWPHAYFYLNYFVFFVFTKLRGLVQAIGLQPLLASNFPLLWQDPLVFYFLARLLSAFLGALTVVPLYLAGKTLFNSRIGFFAALAIAFMPFHVHSSHFALIDVPTAFWISWAIYFSTKIFKENYVFKNYILAGLFIGLAASTKYHGGLSALVVAVAHFSKADLSKNNIISNLRFLVVSGLSAIGGFALGTPYSIFDFETFIRTDAPVGALWQFTNVGSVTFAQQLTQFFEAISYRFILDIGPTFIILYLAHIIYSIFVNKDRRSIMILLPSLFLFYYISGFSKNRAHYYMPTYPFVALTAGYMTFIILEKLKNEKLQKVVNWLIFIIPILISLNLSYVLTKKDTRVELYEWLQSNITLTDQLVYNSSSIASVMEKISKDRSTKGVNQKNLIGKEGYAIVYKDLEDLPNYFAGKDEESFLVKKEYPLVLKINSEGRRGGEIFVYAISKN